MSDTTPAKFTSILGDNTEEKPPQADGESPSSPDSPQENPAPNPAEMQETPASPKPDYVPNAPIPPGGASPWDALTGGVMPEGKSEPAPVSEPTADTEPDQESVVEGKVSEEGETPQMGPQPQPEPVKAEPLSDVEKTPTAGENITPPKTDALEESPKPDSAEMAQPQPSSEVQAKTKEPPDDHAAAKVEAEEMPGVKQSASVPLTDPIMPVSGRMVSKQGNNAPLPSSPTSKPDESGAPSEDERLQLEQRAKEMIKELDSMKKTEGSGGAGSGGTGGGAGGPGDVPVRTTSTLRSNLALKVGAGLLGIVVLGLGIAVGTKMLSIPGIGDIRQQAGGTVTPAPGGDYCCRPKCCDGTYVKTNCQNTPPAPGVNLCSGIDLNALCSNHGGYNNCGPDPEIVKCSCQRWDDACGTNCTFPNGTKAEVERRAANSCSRIVAMCDINTGEVRYEEYNSSHVCFGKLDQCKNPFAENPCVTPTPTPVSRPGLCVRTDITKTSLLPGESTTVTLIANKAVKGFHMAFYNLDNLYSPGNPKPYFNVPNTQLTMYKEAPNTSTTTMSFTVTYADLSQQDLHPDWDGSIPKKVQINGYFTDFNGGFSAPDPNCVEWISRVVVTPTPTRAPSPTPTTRPSPTPTRPPACNSTCTSSNQCPSGLTCSSGRCRNAACVAESDCTCNPTPTPTPVPLACMAIGFSNTNPNLGDTVTLTCTGAPSAQVGTAQYQVSINSSPFADLPNKTNTTAELRVNQTGHYEVRCRVCKASSVSGGLTGCTDWQPGIANTR